MKQKANKAAAPAAKTDAEIKADEKAAKKAAKAANAVTEIPAFKDAEGQLRKLRMKMFPRTKEGRMAYADLQIARWEEKKVAYAAGTDSKARKLKRVDRLKKKLAALEAELSE